MQRTWNRTEELVAVLRREMIDRGYFQRPPAPILAILAGHLALALGGLIGLAWAPSLAWKAVALLISSFGFIGLGTVGHTASHASAGKSALLNRVIYYTCYPVMLQLSASYWRHSHLVVHHPAPNVVGVDDDCDLRPLFAVNREHLATVGAPLRRWPLLQGLILPLVLPLNGFNILRQSWSHLFRLMLRGGRRGFDEWLDLGCLVLNPVLLIGVPMLFLPATEVLLVYALRMMLIGIGLFAVLAPGHFPAEAACIAADQRHVSDYWLRQGATTVNFRTGLLGRFLCCGLEYQIEHHLFPSVSPIHYRKMSSLVRDFCQESGIPYRTLGWGEAIWQSWLAFFHPKPVVADVESLRKPGPRDVANS